MQNSHRMIQLFCQQALAPSEVWLEKYFPSIHRIADVVYPDQKIIFEIQCSLISVHEIRARNRDYQKLGYTVVWILHEHRYNRLYLTPAERFLQSHIHYFTNITSYGQGEIYDQYAVIQWGKRLKRTVRYPITLSLPNQLKQIPHHFPKERKKWTHSFFGDLFHHPFQPIKPPPLYFYRTAFYLFFKTQVSE